MSIHIGTSGWHYKSWVGPYYPAGFPAEQMLAYYARDFATVEIDNSFYRLPTDDTLRRWVAATPPDFVFAFKASRYLTHWRKLTEPTEPLARVMHSAGLLRPKLGPVLFQLPPHWHVDLQRLRFFLSQLPPDDRFAFEFRDPSWFTPPVYDALREHGVALCVYELGAFRSPLETTADFVYIRLHGPAGPYSGLYATAALSFWHERIAAWEAESHDTFCYFDNDERGFAVRNARELKFMVET